MPEITIDEDELLETQHLASQYIPMKAEAERLALAVRSMAPSHPSIKGELWQGFFAEHDKKFEREPAPLDLDMNSQEVASYVAEKDRADKTGERQG